MGNAWYCRKCEEGRVGLSTACIERFINEETGEPTSSEEKWINKLICVDETHSRQQGITVKNFELLYKKIDSYVKAAKAPACNDRAALLDCLKENPECMIRCKQQMDDFINCVDSVRIYMIKQKILEQRKEEKLRQLEESKNKLKMFVLQK